MLENAKSSWTNARDVEKVMWERHRVCMRDPNRRKQVRVDG